MNVTGVQTCALPISIRERPRPTPRDDRRRGAIARQQIDQVAAGETGGTRDEHFVHRGTLPSAPLNGEKLPRPASVNVRKKRWSDGIGNSALPAGKLYC